MNLSSLNWNLLLPELVVSATSLIVLITAVVGRVSRADRVARGHVLAAVTLIGLIIAAVLTILQLPQPAADFMGMVQNDALSRYLNLIILLAAILAVLLAWEYLSRFTYSFSEFYALLLLAVVGMMFLGKSTELITLFVSLEILSISLYILTGFNRHQLASAEGSMKYFLLGAFASGFIVYGAALLYGDAGSTWFSDIATNASGGFLTLAGLALLLVGFAFKVAAVPFHMWTPDAYQGAPTPVTAFMSVGTKAAALVALFRVLQTVVSAPYETWAWALAILSLLTMTVGNVAALRQTSIKRLLAYSSIAQAGYMLIGLVAGTVFGLQAMLFYLFAYAFMNIGAFACASLLESDDWSEPQDASMANARGLFGRKPLLATALAIFMFSLAGIPPLAGFFGKLYLFNAAIEAGWLWLALVGVINSVISAYYYMRVVVVMFMEPADESTRVRMPIPDSAALAIVIAVLGALLLGILAGPGFASLGQAVVAWSG